MAKAKNLVKIVRNKIFENIIIVDGLPGVANIAFPHFHLIGLILVTLEIEFICGLHHLKNI